MIAAAIITPSTDPFSITLVTNRCNACTSQIFVAAKVYKEREKRDAEEWS